VPLSKLDRVKMFVELLVKTIRNDDMLGIVTFGTTARVVLPLRRMSDDDKVSVEYLSTRCSKKRLPFLFAVVCTKVNRF